MVVQLYKRTREVEKSGETKRFTNFYVKCGEDLIPINIKFFPNDENYDPMFRARTMTLKNFAEELPENEAK